MSRPVKITSTSKPPWRCDQWGSQMSVKRIVPDIKSKHLDASRQFYVEVLGLDRDGHGLHRDISIAEQSDLLR